MKSMQRIRKSSREKIKKKKRGVEDIKNKQKKIVLPLPLTKTSPSKKNPYHPHNPDNGQQNFVKKKKLSKK